MFVCSDLHSSREYSLFSHPLKYIYLLPEDIVVKILYTNVHISVVDLFAVSYDA